MEARHQVMTDHKHPQPTSSLTLAAVPTAVRLARLFLRQRLSLWGLSRLIDDAELVLSELVTNAVNVTGNTNPKPRWSELHNLALITVRLVITQDSVVIEVWDRDPSPPVLKQPEEADEAGRGLLIVGALCRRWDYFFPESGGKAVWGELAIPDHGLLPSGLPKRHDPRLAAPGPAVAMLSVETMERVLEGLRKL
jgi:anti-sigma regulatory factor (Ser/Thr protein kinase)